MAMYPCTNERCPNKRHRSPVCPNLSKGRRSGVSSTTSPPPPPLPGETTTSPSASPFADAVTVLRSGEGDRTSVRVPVETLNIEEMTAAGKPVSHLEVDVYYHLGGTNYFRGVEEERGYYMSVQPVRVEGGFVEMVPTQGNKTLLQGAGRRSKGGRQRANEKVTTELVESMAEQIDGYRSKRVDGLPANFTVEEQWEVPDGYERIATDVVMPYPGPNEVDQTGRLTALNLGYPVGRLRGSSIDSVALRNGKTIGLGGMMGEEVTYLHLRDADGKQEHVMTMDEGVNSQDTVELAFEVAESDDPSSAVETVFGEAGFEMSTRGHVKEFTHPDIDGTVSFA